jgi:hypothetical protein
MIVIGADTHKRNHMLVAVDGQTGAVRGQLAIAASDAGALEALRFAEWSGAGTGVGDRGLPARVRAPGSGADRCRRAGDPGPGRDDRPGAEGLAACGKV